MKTKDEQRVLEKFWNTRTVEKNYVLLRKIVKLEDQGVDVENLLNQIVKISDAVDQILKTGADAKGLKSVIHSLIARTNATIKEVHYG